ncbi:MAG: calcium/sodium antiporter [Alphaproteobacteria bacterium]|jgi:cation:H+ antiporter|nr:calcium/sodium antiporter [Alphaproteobacteria bacterium]MDP6590275.1 calcium/sodium antiporter [Alphaproteobacteria bacterium]
MDALTIIKLVAGFVLLFCGGEVLVRGSVSLARRLQVSPFLIGATVIAFGTSAPELVVSLKAAFDDAMGIALGNIVGSNIANLLLILGMAALFAPVVVNRGAVLRDSLSLAAASLLLTLFVAMGEITRWQGGLMFVLLAALIVYSYWSERRRATPSGESGSGEEAEPPELQHNVTTALVFVVTGLASVAFGAHLLVEAAVVVARGIGMSEAVIGLTVVAVGSSLPELATSIVAAYHKHADVALGNVIGSSVFNILGILGLVSVIHPIAAPHEIAVFDIWIMLGTTALVLTPVFAGWRIGRPLGGFFVLLYAGFITVQYLGFLKP